MAKSTFHNIMIGVALVSPHVHSNQVFILMQTFEKLHYLVLTQHIVTDVDKPEVLIILDPFG